jgi:hypothetical protein
MAFLKTKKWINDSVTGALRGLQLERKELRQESRGIGFEILRDKQRAICLF